MHTAARLLLLPALAALALLTACEDTAFKTKDASGFSDEERLQALLRRDVLPGMKPGQVIQCWGPPQTKQAAADGEEWIYYSGPAGQGFDVHTTVKFSQGKVSDVTNGDLMAGRFR